MRREKTPVAVVTLLVVVGGCAQRTATPGRPATQRKDVTFTRYSPLSRAEEILRRTLPPLTFQRGQQALSARKQALAEQAIDLRKERFAVYVPEGAPPPSGYGLLGELAACNARIERELTAKLAEARAAIARGDREGARAQLKAVDGRYGGLAAPAVVELDEKLAAQE